MSNSKKNRQRKERFSDVQQLIERIAEESPKSGDYFYDYKLEEAKKEKDLLNDQQFHRKYKINFSDLPISQACIKGLANRQFTKMTQIQRCVIPHALADRDVMAASRTGSGKTLCYLIPMIEKLYRHKFIPMDGLGAIVIVPVRQLAIQVFQVLNSFTKNIQINVGLTIGGKSVQFQKQKINNMNILICTPGRLLQHIEQTYGFEVGNLQMLVLDEADVMMEMGFQETLKSIVSNLPKCQTLLFSATLNNQIKLLANLRLQHPQKVFINSTKRNLNDQKDENQNKQNGYETPVKLTQYYMEVNPQEKINTLYSFLKTHQRQKIIVFVSTCKQVRFIYQSFKRFRLGLPMYELQGHQKQKKRMAIYFTFCQKKYGLLVCTNIASRGLDFPLVDWVIQFDVPENIQTYVHRVGRTARFKYEGKSLTFVAPSENKFIKQLKQKDIIIHKIKQNPQKYLRIQRSLQSICSQHQDIKYLAQRALISYMKFVFKAQNKDVFNIKGIDSTKLAESFGLQGAPVVSIKGAKKQEGSDSEDQQLEGQQKISKIQKMRMKAKLKKNQIKQAKKAAKQLQKADKNQSEPEQELSQSYEQQNQPKNKTNKIAKQENRRANKAKDQSKQHQFEQEDLLVVKNKHKKDPNQKPILSVSKNRTKKIRNQGLFDGKNITHFDDDLNPITDQEHLRQKYLKENQKTIHIDRDFSHILTKNKLKDEQIQKQRRKQKRTKIRDQIKQAKGQILPQSSKRSKFQAQVQLQSEEQLEQQQYQQ